MAKTTEATNPLETLFDPKNDSEDLVALLEAKDKLELKIKAKRSEQRASALHQINTLIQVHGFTAADLFPGVTMKTGRTRTGPGSSVGSSPAPAVYRDPVSGKTWSGRGRIPSWIKDKNRDDFLINP